MKDFPPTALNNALEGERSFVTGPDPIVVPFSAENTIPTFAINIASSSVTEGNQVIVNVTTTNISNGTRLFITPGSGGSGGGGLGLRHVHLAANVATGGPAVALAECAGGGSDVI